MSLAGATVAGGATSAYGQYQAGKAQSNYYGYLSNIRLGATTTACDR